MRIKILLFIIATSVLFNGCVNKTQNKKVEKTKSISLHDVLNDSKLFEYDENQKLYKNKFTQDQNRNDLLLKLGNLCSEKKGKLVYTNYFINSEYVNTYINNKAYICEIQNAPYFIGHLANQDSNSYLSISINENTKKEYVNKQTAIKKLSESKFEVTLPTQISAQEAIQEREEIKKREKAREQKAKLMFSKKNQSTMTFFDSWKQIGTDPLCSTKCKNINKKTTGFTTLQEATAQKWQLISKVNEISETIDTTCTCSGSSVILKKLSN